MNKKNTPQLLYLAFLVFTGYPLTASSGDTLKAPPVLESHSMNIDSDSHPIIVTDTCQTCPGSLADAIDKANTNPGPDTIIFNLPGDPPFVFCFEPAYSLRNGNTVIDASTQPGWKLGDIIFDGAPYSYYQSTGGNFNFLIYGTLDGYALDLRANDIEVYGIYFKNYSRYALKVVNANATIGAPGKGNAFGRNSRESGVNNLNRADIISQGRNTLIQSNYFGFGIDSTSIPKRGGIQINEGQEIQIGGNRLAGEGNLFFHCASGLITNSGLPLDMPNEITSESSFSGNTLIGCETAINITKPVFPIIYNNGLPVYDHVENFTIGGAVPEEWNLFKKCGKVVSSYLLEEEGKLAEIILWGNRYQCNDTIIGSYNYYSTINIPLSNLAQVVTITKADIGEISGISPPNNTIQIYRAVDSAICPNAACQGDSLIAITNADTSGQWSLILNEDEFIPSDWEVTAIAVDTAGNTSLFAECRPVECPSLLPFLSIDTSICYGEEIIVNGVNYDSSGIFLDTLTHPSGCSFAQRVSLEVLSEKVHYIDTTICSGDSILVNGTAYIETVMEAVEIVPAVGTHGCDSTIFINLAVQEAPPIFDSSAIVISTQDTIIISTVGDFVNYLWHDGSIGPSLQILGSDYIPGMYEVSTTVQDEAGCTWEDSLQLIVEEVVGLKTGLESLPFRFFPNPSSGRLNVHINQEYFELKLSFLTPGGQVLKEEVVKGPTSIIDLSGLPPGYYLLRWSFSRDNGACPFILHPNH